MKNKRALVCGSSKGIGAATAIELSKLGTSIILLARDEKSLTEVMNNLDKSHNQKHDYIIVYIKNQNNDLIFDNAYMITQHKEKERNQKC